MGVYIKNVEMPIDHPLWIVVHSDGTVEANEVSQSRPVGWQTLRNAAVPVPPHGDLVDKKTVSENLAKVLSEKNPPFSYPDWNDAVVAMLTAPTVIEADGGDAQ